MKMHQDCIDFVAKHSIYPETKSISTLGELEEAEEAIRKGSHNSQHRFVIDIEEVMKSSQAELDWK